MLQDLLHQRRCRALLKVAIEESLHEHLLEDELAVRCQVAQSEVLDRADLVVHAPLRDLQQLGTNVHGVLVRFLEEEVLVHALRTVLYALEDSVFVLVLGLSHLQHLL